MHKGNGIAERYWRTFAIIKDLLLIDISLPVNFLAEAMDTANYFCKILSTRFVRPASIPEEAWTSIRQNLEHLQIFRSSVSTLISNKKGTKSDVQEIWKGIFIGYMRTSKHLKV